MKIQGLILQFGRQKCWFMSGILNLKAEHLRKTVLLNHGYEKHKRGREKEESLPTCYHSFSHS